VHLYRGTTQEFIGDATQARLANQVSDRFIAEFRYRPSPSEVTSWHNSLPAMANVLQYDEVDFCVGNVRELDRLIRERAGEGSTARLVAGFCWPWSDPDDTSQLEPDVRVGDWWMPCNAKADAARLGPRIPKSDFWASDPNGLDQVGCVYTAQGFEFDYVGVIFGPDLVYRPMQGGWLGQRDQSHDRVVRRRVTEAEFTRYVKSTYGVLPTRGLRGCYVYFMDAPTRDFCLSRTEASAQGASLVRAAELPGAYRSRP
jgi:hypothetical protein